MSSTCFDPEGSSSGRRLYMQSSAHKSAYTMNIKRTVPYRNCIYSCLPEDEPSGSKRVEDIQKY